MIKEVHQRFPLSAAALTLTLALSGSLAHAQDLSGLAQTAAPLSPALRGEPEPLGRSARRVDDTILKQVIVFARHAVRSPVLPNSTLDLFSSQPFPLFSSSNANITVNGRQNEVLLGGYYRLWLTQQGLLTGNDTADAAFVYARANGLPLILDTAQAFWSGLLPGAPVNVNFDPPPENDPLFVPVAAGVAQLDMQMAVASVLGRLGGNPQSLASAYAPELALTRAILFGYPVGQSPTPATPAGKIDVTTLPITAIAGNDAQPVNFGGMATLIGAIDPFIMEYADGLPASEVGWGQLTAAGINQNTRLYNLLLDLEYRTPYLARVQSSNTASHIVRSLVQAATGNAMTGALGSPSTKIMVLTAANTNVTGLAGLFHLDWSLPGYQPDTCSPGGALVFELRQSQSTGEYIVRTSYVTQTMDQLRNLTALTLAAPPAIAPLFVPGCSRDNATFDCSLADFVDLASYSIDPQSTDLMN
jgi:4-phytase/acid phosphatase